MSRFINYTEELNEKVSKKEIDIALKNDNVIIGQEFEMKIPVFGNVDIQDEYEKAVKEYDQWYQDIKEYDEKIEEYEEETLEMRKSNDFLNDYINDISLFLEPEYEDDEEAFNKEWVNGEMAEWISGANTDEIYKLIGEKPFKKSDVNTYENLEDIAGLMQSEADDLESTLKYREEEGKYEYLDSYMPYILNNDYSNYVNYLREYQFIDIESDVQNGKYMPGDYEDIPVVYDPDELGSFDTLDYEEELNLDDAPFTKYKIGDYQEVSQSVGSGVWAIEPDESLGVNGVEIKSPPMVTTIAMKNMDAMFDWMIDNDYYTDNSCGFHAHLSIKGVKNIKNVIDPLKLIMFTDEEYIFHTFKERMNNGYVRSVHNKLKSGGDISVDGMKDIISKKKLMMKMSSEHFDAINFVQDDNGHVEFRYLGGQHYERKSKDIKKVLGTFIHNFSLACDKDYKLKEYTQKLNKMFNKLEYYSKNIKIRKIQKIVDKYFSGNNVIPAKLNKMLKSYQSSVKSLKSIYKLTNKEHHLLMQNRNFVISINEELKNDLTKLFKQAGYNKNIIFDMLSTVYLV